MVGEGSRDKIINIGSSSRRMAYSLEKKNKREPHSCCNKAVQAAGKQSLQTLNVHYVGIRIQKAVSISMHSGKIPILSGSVRQRKQKIIKKGA